MSRDFCLTYPSSALVAEFGPFFLGKVGVCMVRQGFSETFIVSSDELDGLAQGIDRIPTVPGQRPVLLSFEDEFVLTERIRHEAASLLAVSRPTLPNNFMRPSAMWVNMVWVEIAPGLVNIRLERGLTDALGWREGDCISLGISTDGTQIALAYDPNGQPLPGSNMPMCFPSGVMLPLDAMSAGSSKFVTVPCEVRDQVIFIRTKDCIEVQAAQGRSTPEAPSINVALPTRREPPASARLQFHVGRIANFLTMASPIR